jgi:hypothetical protein
MQMQARERGFIEQLALNSHCSAHGFNKSQPIADTQLTCPTELPFDADSFDVLLRQQGLQYFPTARRQ